jgi:hypothetical protein
MTTGNRTHEGIRSVALCGSMATGLIATVLISAAVAADVASRVDLTLTGGPHAGSYTITSLLGCDFQDYLSDTGGEPPAFLGDFGTETRAHSQIGLQRNQLGRVTLIIPNVRSPRQDVFSLGVTFGDANDRQQRGTFYEIYTVPVELRSELELAVDGEKPITGRGRVSVDRNTRNATIEFSGETGDGVQIEGVVQCNAFVS